MDDLNLWLVGGGLFIGLLFGILVQRTQFCMVTAVSNIVLVRDYWLVVIGGGLLFGVGSMLAGGCAGRTAVRAAEGNLGALVVLLAFALTAAGTYYGALEPYRVWLIQNTAVEPKAGDSALSTVLGLPLWFGPAAIAFACTLGIVFLGQAARNFRLMTAGMIVGVLVIAGWCISGYLSHDDFNAPQAASITIAGPLARATVYLTTGSLPGSGFTVPVLSGIVAGASSSALATGSFHLIIPEAQHLKHLLAGGALMGIGAICAGGCNIGNGLTGMSTGSLRALTAAVAIVAGMLLGIALLSRTEKVEMPDYNQHQSTHGVGA